MVERRTLRLRAEVLALASPTTSLNPIEGEKANRIKLPCTTSVDKMRRIIGNKTEDSDGENPKLPPERRLLGNVVVENP